MADIRKEQERDELHRAIWAIADELRGSVDGWIKRRRYGSLQIAWRVLSIRYKQ